MTKKIHLKFDEFFFYSNKAKQSTGQYGQKLHNTDKNWTKIGENGQSRTMRTKVTQYGQNWTNWTAWIKMDKEVKIHKIKYLSEFISPSLLPDLNYKNAI